MADHRTEISADAKVNKASKDVKNLKADIEAVGPSGKSASGCKMATELAL